MSVPKLKVCPNPSCPESGKVQMSRYPVYRVCCEGCGMEGPMALSVSAEAQDRKNRTEAAKLWNGIKR